MIDTKTAIEKITNGEFDNLFTDIYIDSSMIDYQKKRYVHAIEQYETIFCPDKVAIFSAPGRSEVCGNHTDHQHGMVLATSINLDTIAVSAKNNNDVVRFVSDGYDMITLNINDLEVNNDEAGTTVSLIRGVLRGLKDHGYKIGGFNAYATSDVLVGAGLSSSAAFEVVVGTIISGLYNDMKINSVEIAQISQYAENVFFKKPCGLMDQMACSVGGMVNIDFKDPTKPIVKKVPTEFEKYDYSLCIVDTKGDHVDLTDDYAMIPSEMKKVANFLGEDYLRDCDSNEFYIRLDEIREAVGDRYFVQFISLMRSIMLKMPFRHLKTVSLLNSLTQSENPVIHRLSIFRMYIQQEIFNIRTSRLPLHSAKAFFAITACAVFTAVDLQVQFRRLSKMIL